MAPTLAFLTIPGLRPQDLALLPSLQSLVAENETRRIQHSFPAVTWPSQATMLTGKLPSEHGVVANGFFWRDSGKVEMWTAWNEKILAPQLWDLLHDLPGRPSSAAWFPMLSKGSGADYICMPAPIHKPDGSEELWCYTRPQEFYGELKERLGHFPLQHFWGPLANVKSSEWIAESIVMTAEKFRPRFLYIYLPHLDYAAQKLGPDSPAAQQAVRDLDGVLAKLIASLRDVYQDALQWLVASEYVITEVDHVSYPNRVLREAGLLSLDEVEGRELLNPAMSSAWAMVDHQFSHVFVRDRDASVIERVESLFADQPGFECVLSGDKRADVGMNHERAGDVVLVSKANSWQAYYWWLDDDRAPTFARTVDIHRKPGYDPVELHVDMATRSIPLDATLIKGSHGALVRSEAQRGLLLTTLGDRFQESLVADTSIAGTVLDWFRGVGN
ncbi:MAG: alkaline phosphatase family protein [Planctomycetales bacterium]|nr:alkaline phosphatase family protein [Planctomycetales bacterium]